MVVYKKYSSVYYTQIGYPELSLNYEAFKYIFWVQHHLNKWYRHLLKDLDELMYVELKERLAQRLEKKLYEVPAGG